MFFSCFSNICLLQFIHHQNEIKKGTANEQSIASNEMDKPDRQVVDYYLCVFQSLVDRESMPAGYSIRHPR